MKVLVISAICVLAGWAAFLFSALVMICTGTGVDALGWFGDGAHLACLFGISIFAGLVAISAVAGMKLFLALQD